MQLNPRALAVGLTVAVTLGGLCGELAALAEETTKAKSADTSPVCKPAGLERCVGLLPQNNLWAGLPDRLTFDNGELSIDLPPADRKLLILAAVAPCENKQDTEMRVAQRLAYALARQDPKVKNPDVFRAATVDSPASGALNKQLDELEARGLVTHCNPDGKYSWWRTPAGNTLVSAGSTDANTQKALDELKW